MKNAKILIAADNELSRDNLSELLKRQGYEVMPVENGRQARDAKEQNPSDLIGVREVRDREGNIVTIYSTGPPDERRLR
jgi:CheY-like chemotaxis protein